KDREGNIQRGIAGPRQRQAVVNHEGGAHDLPDQFLVRLGVDQIVDQAHQEKKSGGADDDVYQGAGKVSPGLAGKWSNETNITNHDRQPDGDAAKHRRWLLVPAISLG